MIYFIDIRLIFYLYFSIYILVYFSDILVLSNQTINFILNIEIKSIFFINNNLSLCAKYYIQYL